MFDKILIANRGEIALRIIRTCRDMGIRTVAVFTPVDRDALHVRLADECTPLHSPLGYRDGGEMLEAARRTGAAAIHPGYGFLAEDASFAAACADAGFILIGPPAGQQAIFQDKIATLETVRRAGFATPAFSPESMGVDDDGLVAEQATQLGFPLMIKSCRGGRGRATRIVPQPDDLREQVRQARREAETVFGGSRLYLERVIAPARLLSVQIMGDRDGNLVHLGERQAVLQPHVQKLIEESPAPDLAQTVREQLWETALAIARLFGFVGAGAVEFLLDAHNRFYFTEFKPRITVDHPTTEILTRIDLVRAQIELASGKALRFRQADVRLSGWAIQCQVRAEEPWNHFLPSPGILRDFRVPGGAYIRVDSYGCTGCPVPVQYDPLLAKLAVWGETREDALRRLHRVLDEFVVRGVHTNLPLLHQVIDHPDFVRGVYDMALLMRSLPPRPAPEPALRDLAIAAAVAFAAREESGLPTIPPQLLSGWHRASRTL
jgi:acetyl/propionyl-CoA carboxylase alpha subunit